MKTRPARRALIMTGRDLDRSPARRHPDQISVADPEPLRVLGRNVDRPADPNRGVEAARLNARVVAVEMAAGRQAIGIVDGQACRPVAPSRLE